jgi:SAM-dependent methyltransferase
MSDWWQYQNLPSGAPYDWSPAERGDHEYDSLDFHLDIGAGVVPKARMGLDRHMALGIDLVVDLETLLPAPVGTPAGEHYATVGLYEEAIEKGWLPFGCGLPFPENSIESIISHHCFEHVGDGFVRLMDECHRVLKPGGILRIITPLFPSKAAVEDPDHKRYFMEETFETFCGASDGSHWHESFSVPYTSCRFEMAHKTITPPVEPEDAWGPEDVREIRVALRKWSLEEVAQHENQVHQGRESSGGDGLAAGAFNPEPGRGRDLAGVA